MIALNFNLGLFTVFNLTRTLVRFCGFAANVWQEQILAVRNTGDYIVTIIFLSSKFPWTR